MPKTHQPRGTGKVPTRVPKLVTAVTPPQVCLTPAPSMHPMPHIDITGATIVEVESSADGTRLWVNVNGVCTLRCCKIKTLVIK